MRFAPGAVACIALVMALGVAQAHARPDLKRYDRRGISFEYPSSWFVTNEPLSNGSNPDYRFAASTAPVRRTRHDEGPCLRGIGRQLPRAGALVFLREYRGASRRRALPRLDPLPRRLRLTPGSVMYCMPRPALGAWENFRAAGRAFVLGVHLGPKAREETERELRRLVASLEIRPRR